jgi:hypothetical protein
MIIRFICQIALVSRISPHSSRGTVRNNGDVVVGWHRLKHRNGYRDIVFIFSIALAEDEGVMEKYNLTNVIWKVSAVPWIFSSHRKSGIMDK